MSRPIAWFSPATLKETWGLVVNEAMASGLPCIVSDACGCAEDLVKPIRPDLCYPVGDITALERAMAAAITDTPPPQLLRAHISKYDVSKTIDAVESLYLERAQPNQIVILAGTFKRGYAPVVQCDAGRGSGDRDFAGALGLAMDSVC